MSATFEDIEITGIDDKASSRPDSRMALFDIVLTLSKSAPYEWSEYFDALWQRHIYMMKRSASVSGNRLTIHCVPDELEQYHLPELKRVIAEVNQEYGRFFHSQLEQRQQEQRQKNEDGEAIQNLKKNFKL